MSPPPLPTPPCTAHHERQLDHSSGGNSHSKTMELEAISLPREHGRRDEPGHGLGAERVDLEPQRRERRRHRAPQQLRLRVRPVHCPGLRGQEVEEDGLRAGRVLEQRVHRRHGAPQVVRVERHGDVHQARVAHPRRRSRTPFPVPVLRRLRKPWQRRRGTRNLDGQEDHRRRHNSGPHRLARSAAHGRW
uniref:Uncharacterized protein n=1 Tax=Zea mays TaxID=4577 RepID=C0P6U4_MAIZE|nr:unknown [Zea mays]